MNVHKNARTTTHSRAELVRRVKEGQEPRAVATALGIDIKTVKKWVARFEAEGAAGLADRSSRPHRLNRPTTDDVCVRILELRRQRWTGKQIAKETKVSAATVSRILRAARLSRMRDLEPSAPVIRYEYDTPGGLIHLDIKKLGRFERTGHRITGKRPRPTARPSASSRPACVSGPTPRPTPPRITVRPSCPSGFTATTGIGPTVG